MLQGLTGILGIVLGIIVLLAIQTIPILFSWAFIWMYLTASHCPKAVKKYSLLSITISVFLFSWIWFIGLQIKDEGILNLLMATIIGSGLCLFSFVTSVLPVELLIVKRKFYRAIQSEMMKAILYILIVVAINLPLILIIDFATELTLWPSLLLWLPTFSFGLSIYKYLIWRDTRKEIVSVAP